MKIGFCAKIEMLREVADAGYDYIELPVSVAAAWTEEEFQRNLALLNASPISAPSFNLLFPGDLALLAPETKNETVSAYLHKALSRVQQLGGKTVVFGSGKARTRPESISYDQAFRRLTEVTRLAGEAAAQYGVTVAIEPLNRRETNMINSVAEGACLRAAANHPNVGLLADYYHIAVEHQPPEDVARLGGIAHCHIATEIGRKAPLEAEAGFTALFSAMKRTGYTGLISVEGKSENLAQEGPVTVRLLKKLWEEA